MDYHEMTDKLYEGLEDFVDAIAEKIIMQGEKPLVLLHDYVKASKIKETEKNKFTTKEVAKIIYNDLNTYCKLVEKTKSNAYTQPLLDEIIVFADKQRWFFKVSQ